MSAPFWLKMMQSNDRKKDCREKKNEAKKKNEQQVER